MIRKISISSMALLVIFLCIVMVAAATAREPQKPDVNSPLDSGKEAKINELIGLPSSEAFDRLKGIDYFLSEELSDRAVYLTFKGRKEEAIALALDSLRLPVIEILRGKMVSRSADIRVARKIFEVFPDESVNSILDRYGKSDALTKGNIIRVLAKMAGGNPIRDLLIETLDDKTPCEEENPEVGGDPLRLCDIAYNQLVLRYNVKQVLRAIGPVYRIEVRDYHIDILKNKLKAGQIQ
jgi:hypothetical protein